MTRKSNEIKQESMLYAGQNRYNYIDCYEFILNDPDNRICITNIGECFIAPDPKWMERLMVLRNSIVSIFGLKTSLPEQSGNRWEIGSHAGIFKVFGKTTNEIILGDDDKHLDCRVSLLLEQDKQYKRVAVTTTVKYHNWLGRCYFFFVKPIHRLIVPLTLKTKFKRLVEESDRMQLNRISNQFKNKQ